MFLSENGVNENFIVLNVSFFFSPEAIVKEDDTKTQRIVRSFFLLSHLPFYILSDFFFIR